MTRNEMLLEFKSMRTILNNIANNGTYEEHEADVIGEISSCFKYFIDKLEAEKRDNEVIMSERI